MINKKDKMTSRTIKTTVLASVLALGMLTMAVIYAPNVDAEEKVDLEGLVDQYGEIAEINIDAGKLRDFNQKLLENEMKRSQPDTETITNIQSIIDEQS